jgi:hypothetical protein
MAGSSITVTDIRKFFRHVKKTTMWHQANAFNTDPKVPASIEDMVRILKAGLESYICKMPINTDAWEIFESESPKMKAFCWHMFACAAQSSDDIEALMCTLTFSEVITIITSIISTDGRPFKEDLSEALENAMTSLKLRTATRCDKTKRDESDDSGREQPTQPVPEEVETSVSNAALEAASDETIVVTAEVAEEVAVVASV